MNLIRKVFALAAVVVASFSVSARADLLSEQELLSLSQQTTINMINWRVGDRMDYQVSIGMFGKIGAMFKTVTKDEGTALWIHQEVDLKFQKQVVDMLLNKADGKILKLIQDGKEVQVPNDKLEVISQDYGEVTVPAGTFDAVHIIAKTQQISKIELWANPAETVMDGGLKQIMETQMGKITMELVKFSKGQ
ncbi:MAG: hypothetical protein ACK5QT_11800 [Oligoflexia bacterium]